MSNPPPKTASRRAALGTLGAAGLAPLFACGGSDDATTTASTELAQAVTLGGLAPGASNSNLAALAVSAGTLNPVFGSATYAYSLSVANAVDSITVTPRAAGRNAVISVNGTRVASGSASGAIALAVGTTTLTIVVTAADKRATSTYTIAAVRASADSGDSCALIPQETQGPFPLLAILTNAAMVRRDITEGKAGVPLELVLRLQDVNHGCAPIAGAAVYVWHCDRDGAYSGYSSGANGNHVGETFLRGVQVSDANGELRFTTIYPGWYAGRITHIHFQVYLANDLQVTATATSQIAFPQAVRQLVYASAAYPRGQNTSVADFAADNVFRDGTSLQMATASGSVAAGYSAALTVGIAA